MSSISTSTVFLLFFFAAQTHKWFIVEQGAGLGAGLRCEVRDWRCETGGARLELELDEFPDY